MQSYKQKSEKGKNVWLLCGFDTKRTCFCVRIDEKEGGMSQMTVFLQDEFCYNVDGFQRVWRNRRMSFHPKFLLSESATSPFWG